MATYHFADNTSSLSHPNAIQGNDAWNGLFPTFQGGSDGPKRTPANFNNNLLQAGDRFLLARGSAWDTSFFMFIETVGSSSLAWTNMIEFDEYDPGTGVTGKPIVNCSGAGPAIMIGSFGGSGAATLGGLSFRNWDIRGPRVANPEYDSSGIWMNPPLSHIRVEDCDISNTKVGINNSNTASARHMYVDIHRNTFTNTGLAGTLGSATHMLLEKNTYTGCGEQHALTHAVYYGAGEIENTNTVIRANILRDNNLDALGFCVGGNLTFRGKLRYTTVAGNVVENTGAKYSTAAYGISSAPGYESLDEYSYHCIIDGNRVANFSRLISVSSSPGIRITNNALVDLGVVGESPNCYAIGWPFPELTAPDVTRDERAVVRNNTFFSKTPRTGSKGIYAGGGVNNSAGADVDISGNLIMFEEASEGDIYAFDLSEDETTYTNIRNNLVSGGTGWMAGQLSVAAFEAYLDALAGTTCTGNIDADPLFTAEPSDANNWSMVPTALSPAKNAAVAGLTPALDIMGVDRATPDIGAYSAA